MKKSNKAWALVDGITQEDVNKRGNWAVGAMATLCTIFIIFLSIHPKLF